MHDDHSSTINYLQEWREANLTLVQLSYSKKPSEVMQAGMSRAESEWSCWVNAATFERGKENIGRGWWFSLCV